MFHPSDVASSLDHTASRAGRLGREGASTAADDWLHEEGSGVNTDSVEQPLIAQHCEMQCSALQLISNTGQGTLHPDGSSAAIAGHSSFHAGTDTEDGHATDAPPSSSWHPDDHYSGAGQVDLGTSQ